MWVVNVARVPEEISAERRAGECCPRESRTAWVGSHTKELLKAGFVGQQKGPGSRTRGRETGLLTPEAGPPKFSKFMVVGPCGREGEQLGSSLWVCAFPSRASLHSAIQGGQHAYQETNKDFKFAVFRYRFRSWELCRGGTTL